MIIVSSRGQHGVDSADGKGCRGLYWHPGSSRDGEDILQSCSHVQAMAIALVLLLPGAAAAQAPNVCDTVARTVVAIDPPDGWRGPWQSPMRALGKASGGTINIDTQAWRSDKEQALDKLRQQYRAGPSLLAEIS